jgi:hypothetical protein
MQMQTRFQGGVTPHPTLDPVKVPVVQWAVVEYMQKGLEAQNEKSKHSCENQGTVPFLHTNQLISVWSKTILPRRAKKKTQSQEHTSDPVKWIPWCGSSSVGYWVMRGN